ncbi:hypothetical protein SDC9_38878 [bioreactor metagenome]|jgi:hypothetical protein|uniref:Uncharacterized protein n=1 Tax=bioreactor metagenome TaxID=1076179 RepID=A0A644VN77_9ZZZZ|nr:hypothetical protein [Paludibacter sp.]
MKKIYLAFIALSLLIITSGCNKELPFPIDEVKRGVLIDIVRVDGSDGVLLDGITTGNYKVKLSVPANQGDYSFMSKVQLLAVLQQVDGSWTSAVVVDNITGFPKEIQIDVADLYSKFQLAAPSVGEIMYLTTNTVLKDGSIVPGWTELAGFNNKAFSGWQVDGRAYSYNVRYPVACAFNEALTKGAYSFESADWQVAGDVTLEADPADPFKLYIAGYPQAEGLTGNGNKIQLIIDPVTYEISGPAVVLASNLAEWGLAAYTNYTYQVVGGSYNTCDGSYNVVFKIYVDQGGWGNNSFTFTRK